MRRSQTPRSQTYRSRELGKPWSRRGEGGPGELGGSLRSRSRLSPPPPANELWASRWPRTDLSPRLTSRRPVRLLTRSELPRLPPGPPLGVPSHPQAEVGLPWVLLPWPSIPVSILRLA